MIDLRKLITGFLVLAALSSYGVLIFSNSQGGRDTAATTDSRTQENFGSGKIAEISDNVFVEFLPESRSALEEEKLTNAGGPNDDGLPEFLPSSNLTENLAQRLVREMVAENPEGPTETAAGLSLPVFDDASLYRAAYLSAGDLGLIDSIPEKELKVIRSDKEERFAEYLASVNRTLTEVEVNFGSESLRREDAPAEGVVGAIKLVLEKASLDITGTPVPKDLLGFHERLVILFENQETIFGAIGDYQSDPLKAMLALEGAERILTENTLALEAESRKLGSREKISKSEWDRFLSLVQNTLGIQAARAQNPLAVPVDCQGVTCAVQEATKTAANATKISFQLKDFLRDIWNTIRRFATEELKTRLVQMMTQRAVKWVQGGGQKKFVENWGEFLGEAANRAAGAAIQKEIPQLCKSFGPLVRAALLPKPYIPSQGGRCTFTQAMGQLTRFYQRFEDGGWVAYSNSLKPYGNIFSSIIETHDKAVIEAVAAERAAELKAMAAQGFVERDSGQTTKVCGAPQPHNLSELVGPPSGNPVDDAEYIAGLAGEDLDKGAGVAANGDFFTCPVNAWRDTTPGSAIGHTLYTALDAPLHRIVNAQDLIGLISALVDSALNRLIKAGANGLNNLFSHNETNQSRTLEQLCEGLNGDAYTKCIDDANRSTNIENTTPTSPDATQEGQGTQACSGKSGQDYVDCIGSYQGVASSSPGGPIVPPGVNNPPTLISFNGPAIVQRFGGIFPDFWQIRAHDPEGQVLTFQFDWGDGATDTYTALSDNFVFPAPTHVYTIVPGNYLIRVNISDGTNNITATLNIAVLP